MTWNNSLYNPVSHVFDSEVDLFFIAQRIAHVDLVELFMIRINSHFTTRFRTFLMQKLIRFSPHKEIH